MPSASAPRVLICNDDGPPGKSSPYIFDLYVDITRKLGWDVKVVLPSSQKSWIGKAYQIKDLIKGRYFYPQSADGKGEISEHPRPLQPGEVGEWILFDGTPATCVNIALHNLYPGEIDLVLSGPNYGRNTSSAFTLSSGTIGAALAGCLSQCRSIALSYGTFKGTDPLLNKSYRTQANDLSIRIVQRLWTDWGSDPNGLRNGEVDLYNVNVPMVPALEVDGGMDVVWTTILKNHYGQLFQQTDPSTLVKQPPAGPDAPSGSATPTSGNDDQKPGNGLTFHFDPPIMTALVNPPIDSLTEGTDAWALHHLKASVTPLRAGYGEPGEEGMRFASEVELGPMEKGRAFKL